LIDDALHYVQMDVAREIRQEFRLSAGAVASAIT
jgi:hypothetical protein